jgi:hypothetical protein
VKQTSKGVRLPINYTNIQYFVCEKASIDKMFDVAQITNNGVYKSIQLRSI